MNKLTSNILKRLPKTIKDTRCIPIREYHFDMHIRPYDKKHIMCYISHEWREAPVYAEGNSYDECAIKFIERISKPDNIEYFKQLKC